MSAPIFVEGLTAPEPWADPRHESLIDIPHIKGGKGKWTIWPEWSIIPLGNYDPWDHNAAKMQDVHEHFSDSRGEMAMERMKRARTDGSFGDRLKTWNEQPHAGVRQKRKGVPDIVMREMQRRLLQEQMRR